MHIYPGKLLESLNIKKNSSVYALNIKIMILFPESTDWCVCKFSSPAKGTSGPAFFKVHNM